MACAAAYGQTAIVTTIAGGGFVNNAPALQTYLSDPLGVAVNASGDVYIADLSSVGQNHIWLLNHTTQVMTVVAGGGPTVFSSKDGPALSVHIAPTDLALTAGGNLLFMDSSMLRQLNVQQATITTLAGQPNINKSSGDGGLATSALLNMPQQFCQDSAGNIYIVELAGYVRQISTTGIITTIAGTGGAKFGGDGGPATSATLVRPTGIAVDTAGNLYIADSGDLRIREIVKATGIIQTIAGNGAPIDGGDGGSATKATFAAMGVLTIDASNNIYATDGSRIRRITAQTGVISTVAGNGTAGLSGDGGLATQAEINLPGGLTLDSAGDLFIADTGNRRVREVTAAGIISTIAGNSQNGDGGLAAGAVLNGPVGIAVDSSGDLFIAEATDIREINATIGIISTVAGGGTALGDGIPALQAKLNPLSVVFDASGDLIVGEAGVIRKIDTSGVISTIAGTGAAGYSGDGGAATSAQVGYVSALAIDGSGNILFADSGNKRLRKINVSTGVISTVAGNGQASFTGPGQAATATGIGTLAGVAVDGNGNIYIGGIQTYFLLEVSSAGTVSVAGGIGGCGYIGDGGLATTAGMCQPTTLAVDAANNIFLGDPTCYCVRRITAGTGIIQTVFGNGSQGFTGDSGSAIQAQLNTVSAIALFGSTLYVVDGTSNVVRAVTPDTPPALPGPPSFSSLVSSASFQPGPVAPGELITFYGNYLGPVTPDYWTVGSNGLLTIPNSTIQVFFDDVPAPLVYTSAGQVNAVAPYSVANGFSAVKIQTAGGTFTDSSIGSTATAPGIFPSAIVNENGTINGPGSPAPVGSYVTMYGTGLGQTSPAGVDATITPVTDYPKQVYSVAATLSVNPLFSTPLSMNVLYYGPAPGLAAGVCQIDAVIPAGASAGQNFMQISAGPGASPPISLWIQ